jgi:hypothetical protein
MSCIRYSCLFAHSGVQHIMYCIFAFFSLVMSTQYWHLAVSLDCSFLIVPSVFSNAYFILAR